MTSSRFSFLRRVRIHDGECGAVARALHHKAKVISLPAALEKVSTATQERKVMSKKTFFKRIALSAIASLGLSLASAVPSSAGISAHNLYIGAASTATTNTYATTIGTGETATAVVRHTFIADAANDSVTVRVIQQSAAHGGALKFKLTDSSVATSTTDKPYYSTTNGLAGSADITAGGFTISNGHFVNDANANNITSFNVSDSDGSTTARSVGTTVALRLIAPSVAGTYTFTVGTTYWNGGQAENTAKEGPSVTWTVTVTAPDAIATAASTSTLREGTTSVASGTAEGTDSAVFATRSTAGATPAATIWVILKNGTSTADESITAQVTGGTNIAYLNADSDTRAVSGTSVTFKNKGIGDGGIYSDRTPIFVWSNGIAGTATITLTSASGLALGTETVKFYGSVAKIEKVSTYKKVLRAGGFANADVIDILATDAAGIPVPGITSWSMVSSNTANVSTVSSGACASYVTAGYPSLAGYYYCNASTAVGSASGSSATLTYRTPVPLSDPTTYYTVEHAVTLGGSVSTVTLSLTGSNGTSKTSFEPGEVMIVKATAVDSSGNPVYDGVTGPTGLTANKSLGGTITMNAYYDGVSTSQTRSTDDPRVFRNSNNLFAPAASGNFTISGVYGTDNAKTMTVTGTVSDDAATAAASAATDAALEAIDAANAATDAANLAAEAADAATVAAEEARDAADAATSAVEALASEVATLIAGLKAQITTLANTVAKIAKKVKA
jgi:hypothetical protein